MTQLLLAAAGLPHSAPLPPRVHDLDLIRALPAEHTPAAWTTLLDEEALLAQWCALNNIDWSRYRTAVGLPPSTNQVRS